MKKVLIIICVVLVGLKVLYLVNNSKDASNTQITSSFLNSPSIENIKRIPDFQTHAINGTAQESSSEEVTFTDTSTSVSDYKFKMDTLNEEDLRKTIDDTNQFIKEREWIFKYNNKTLSQEDSEKFADLINLKVAAKIVLIERKQKELLARFQ